VRFRLEVEGQVHAVDLERSGRGWTVAVGGRRWQVDVQPGAHVWSLLLWEGDAGTHAGARSHDVRLLWDGPDAVRVNVDGTDVSVTVAPVTTAGRGGVTEQRRTDGTVRAPMPGRVVRVPVVAGQIVAARQAVVVVEAMKMENELRAPHAGTVRALHVRPGDSVDAGQLLVELDGPQGI
jgi:biotin carboxyl carrier protein